MFTCIRIGKGKTNEGVKHGRGDGGKICSLFQIFVAFTAYDTHQIHTNKYIAALVELITNTFVRVENENMHDSIE